MSNIKQSNTPGELYRAYQETRDNIPSAMLSELMARADALGHEDSIHTIVQAAKVYGNAPEELRMEKKPSWLRLVISKLSAVSTAQLGTAFACLAMVAVVAPMLLSDNTPNFPEVAHLSDCPQCGVYINNATASTRSSLPGIRQIDPETRAAARFGIISARLKIESLRDQDLARANALASLEKQPKTMLSPELTALMATSTPSISVLGEAINKSSQQPVISDAGEALFIANISVRNYARDDGPTNSKAQLQTTLKKAVSALNKVPNPSILQQQRIAELKAEVKNKTYDARLVNAIEAATKALGG